MEFHADNQTFWGEVPVVDAGVDVGARNKMQASGGGLYASWQYRTRRNSTSGQTASAPEVLGQPKEIAIETSK